MPRLKCKVAYDGTDFFGWQVQPSGRTVQGTIESALKRMHKGQEVRITGSGRTDAGVHAKGQVFHFDSDLDIPTEGWRKALNSLLPDDILIKSAESVSPQFHARFDVLKKEYRYRVLRSADLDVFRRHYTYHYPYELDQIRMEKAAERLIGEHDFSAFCAANTNVKTKIRTLNALEILEQQDELIFRLVGNGFLYQMVRIIIGTLIETGSGKRSPENVSQILRAKDRTLAGPTVPGCGLSLWEVTYDKSAGL